MVRTAALLVTEHLSLGVVAAGTLAHQVIGRPSARKTCRSEGPPGHVEKQPSLEDVFLTLVGADAGKES